MGLITRAQNAWNVFFNKSPTQSQHYYSGGYSRRPDRVVFSGNNKKSIVTSVYNRIAMDAAAIEIRHVKLDDEHRYEDTIYSDLNNCFNLEANIDQSGEAFLQDIYMSLLDEGCIAIVPIETDVDPTFTDSYKIYTMRTGKILEWRPKEIQVRVYNDRTGEKEDVWVPKRIAAIVENPLYAVMNEGNSTMQRLIRKMNLLDIIDEQVSSGKLDLIIQVPYSIRSETLRQRADQRRKDIEEQLSGSKYGIAYADGTERITQLNRPVENNLLKQVEYLTSMLYSQLGITQGVLDGSADDKTMTNYFSRTVDPLVRALVSELRRKYLSKTARSQKQSIMYFRNVFGLVPVNDLAESADKFTRNEIMTKNEFRQIVGMKPSKDKKADMLINSNISQSADALPHTINNKQIDKKSEEGEAQYE